MNPAWLVRNILTYWPIRASALDFFRCLLWIYSPKLPKGLRRQEQTIGFSYPLPVGNIRLLVRSNGGADSFIHGEVFWHNYYHLELATPPATILDLGANTGMTAVYFGRVYPQAQLACVEPIPGNLRLLARNLELNAIRAEIVPAAIDIKDGQVTMQLEPIDYGHKIATSYASPSQETIEVEAICVPTILRRMGWARVALLKIDIEGHEKVLLSTNCEWLNVVDTMCIECHDGFGQDDLQRLAQRFGFLPPERLAGIWLLTREANSRKLESC